MIIIIIIAMIKRNNKKYNDNNINKTKSRLVIPLKKQKRTTKTPKQMHQNTPIHPQNKHKINKKQSKQINKPK